MTVTVRLFAMLRERAGRDAFELNLADGATVADALEALRDLDGLGDMLERMPALTAVNLEYAPSDTPLTPGDELAIIPPVSGGGETPVDPKPHVRISAEPLSLSVSLCPLSSSPTPPPSPGICEAMRVASRNHTRVTGCCRAR